MAADYNIQYTVQLKDAPSPSQKTRTMSAAGNLATAVTSFWTTLLTADKASNVLRIEIQDVRPA